MQVKKLSTEQIKNEIKIRVNNIDALNSKIYKLKCDIINNQIDLERLQEELIKRKNNG